MNVIFTCGGTGGHINPALAVAKLLRSRRPGCNILFVGADDGMEKSLVPREGFRLETLTISNFQRKLTPKALAHNYKTVKNLWKAFKKADCIIKEFQPDIILGTGGYASYPTLRRGAKKGIPTAVHESNAVPGLTTRMVAKYADRILVNFEESRQQYEYPERVVVTGMPVQEEFIYTRKADARRQLGLDERPLVVSCWGSLGAREMNKKIAAFMLKEQEAGFPFHHVHATGSFGWRWMPQFVEDLGVDLQKDDGLDMREYIYDMPLLMAAADLVICRGGASTVSEICASGTPCIIVPSPNVTDNHQEKNALVLESHGAGLVLRESQCDGEILFQQAKELLEDKERCGAMSTALRSLCVVDSAQQIYNTILEMTQTD